MEQEFQGISEVIETLNNTKQPLRVYYNTETGEVTASPGYMIELGPFPPATQFDPPYEAEELKLLIAATVEARKNSGDAY